MGAACPVEEAGADGRVGDCREGCGLALAGGRVPVCRVADGLAGLEVPLSGPDPAQPATSNDTVTITTGSTASGPLRAGGRLGILGMSTRTSWPGGARDGDPHSGCVLVALRSTGPTSSSSVVSRRATDGTTITGTRERRTHSSLTEPNAAWAGLRRGR